MGKGGMGNFLRDYLARAVHDIEVRIISMEVRLNSIESQLRRIHDDMRKILEHREKRRWFP